MLRSGYMRNKITQSHLLKTIFSFHLKEQRYLFRRLWCPSELLFGDYMTPPPTDNEYMWSVIADMDKSYSTEYKGRIWWLRKSYFFMWSFFFFSWVVQRRFYQPLFQIWIRKVWYWYSWNGALWQGIWICSKACTHFKIPSRLCKPDSLRAFLWKWEFIFSKTVVVCL